jgi:hypothetical protein
MMKKLGKFQKMMARMGGGLPGMRQQIWDAFGGKSDSVLRETCDRLPQRQP